MGEGRSEMGVGSPPANSRDSPLVPARGRALGSRETGCRGLRVLKQAVTTGEKYNRWPGLGAGRTAAGIDRALRLIFSS